MAILPDLLGPVNIQKSCDNPWMPRGVIRGHGRLSCLHTTRPTLLSSGLLAHFCRNSWGSLIPKPTVLFLSTVNNLCEESRSLSGGPRGPQGVEHSRTGKV